MHRITRGPLRGDFRRVRSQPARSPSPDPSRSAAHSPGLGESTGAPPRLKGPEWEGVRADYSAHFRRD